MAFSIAQMHVDLSVDDRKFQQGMDNASRKTKEFVTDTQRSAAATSGFNDTLTTTGRTLADSMVDGLRKAHNEALGFGNGLNAARSAANLARGALTALVGGSAIAGIKKLVESASDMSETLSKSQVVFKDSARAIEQWSQSSARSMGLARQEALESTATFGNLFVSLGLGTKNAATMSTQMIKLAADLASFNNVRPEDALIALKAGLVGETEPLRNFGVNMNEATLKAQALKMHLIDSTKEALTPATKAAAAYSLILAQTTTAQGDFTRTSAGLANQQRIATAQFKDAAAALGENLLPAATQAITKTNELLEAFNKLPKATQTMSLELVGFAAAGGPLLRSVSGVKDLTVAIYAMFAAAGAGSFAALAGTAGVLAASLGAAYLVAKDVLTVLDTINERNRASELDAGLGKFGDVINKRSDAAQITQDIEALNQLRRMREAGQNYLGTVDPDGPLNDGLKRTGLTVRATASQIEFAITDLLKAQKQLTQEATKIQSDYFNGIKKANGGRVGGPLAKTDPLKGDPTFHKQDDTSAKTGKKTEAEREIESFTQTLAQQKAALAELQAGDGNIAAKIAAQFRLISPARRQELVLIEERIKKLTKEQEAQKAFADAMKSARKTLMTAKYGENSTQALSVQYPGRSPRLSISCAI